MKKLASIIIAAITLACFAAPSPNTGTCTVTWTYDFSANPNVTNFWVYFGTSSSNYIGSVLAGGTNTTATVANLARGNTWFFNVTPVANGVEGDYTTEGIAVINAKPGSAGAVQVIITIQ